MAIPLGSGAIITANLNSSYGISSFNIINGGSGYDSTNPPKIVINDVSTPTVAGVFRPIISSGVITGIRVVSSGSGYIPSSKIRQTAVGIASIGKDGVSDTLKAVYISNPGVGYTAIPSVTIANPDIITGFGTFYFNERIRGSRTGTYGRVKSWDQDDRILKVSNVGIGSTALAFLPGETIVGEESGATWAVQIYTQDNVYDKYTENDQFESLADDIIDFTETNPFGTF